MPLAKFDCPHCEKPAEVNATTGTSSHPCPHCGQAVGLQLSGKGKKLKVKVLPSQPASPAPTKASKKTSRKKSSKAATAVPQAEEAPPAATVSTPVQAPASEVPQPQPSASEAAAPPTPAATKLRGITGPAYEPRPLEGEVFERMKMDPELVAYRRRLIIGVSVIGVLILFATILHLSKGPEEQKPTVALPTKTAEPAKPTASSLSKLPNNTVALRSTDTVGADYKAPEKLTFSTPKAEDSKAASTTSNDPGTVMRSRPILAPSKSIPKTPNATASLVLPGSLASVPVNAPGRRGLMRPRVTGDVPDALDLSAGAKAVAKFLNAPSMQSRLALVANPEAIEPAMRQYYQLNSDGPMRFEQITRSRESDYSDLLSEHTVLLRDGSTREVAVFHDEDGTCYVDWPSLVIYSESDWGEFMASRSTQPKVFRVFAEFDNHYGNLFAEVNNLRCLKLTNPLSPSAPIIYGYANKTDVVGRELDHWVQASGGKPIKLTLRLKYPLDTAEPNQVWITELIGAGWADKPKKRRSSSSIGLR